MLAKANVTGADMVIFDLEDAVAASEKAAGRQLVAGAVRSIKRDDLVVGVRINGWDSPWTLSDLNIIDACNGRLDVVVLPKTDDAGMIRALDLVLAQLESSAGIPVGTIGVHALIESAAGVRNVNEICAASARLSALILGPLDLAASLRQPAASERGRARMDPIAISLVVAARAADRLVIDGPYVAIRDANGLRSDARWAADLGFDAKWAVHPDQIAVINEVFSPDAAEIAHAKRVLEAVAASDGAASLDGQMIDEASRRAAHIVLERGRDAPTTHPHDSDSEH